MSSTNDGMPTNTALTISAGAAVVAFLLLMIVGGFGFFGALILGALIGVIVYVILLMYFPGGASGQAGGTGPVTGSTVGSATGTASGSATAAGSAGTARPASASGAAAASGSAAAKPAAGGASGAAKPAAAGSTKGAGTATGGAAKASKAAKPAAGAAAKSGGAAKPKPAASATPAAPGGVDYDKDGVLEGTDEGTKPAILSAPREGGADNLKEIKGVGPALEKMLHSMGVYHFDQVANWTADEIAWVDANLGRFRGRVSRDDWIGQAKILAAGGETEFSKKVDKGGVY